MVGRVVLLQPTIDYLLPMNTLMKDLIDAFPAQLQEALTIFKAASLKPLRTTPLQVVVSGLGGSGIGGTIVAELSAFEGSMPVHVCKEYSLPSWVSTDTLVIISSYSGETEETLATFQQAIKKGCMIVCITSGGTVAKLATQHNLDAIIIPGGNPPRACLGYSLVQLLGIFEHYGWLKNALSSVEKAMNYMVTHKTHFLSEGEAIAKSISYSLPIIYTCSGYEGIAIRFRQQLNENAKMLCWHHVLPEMNHNELVGWADKNAKIATMYFKNEDDFYRTAKRMDIVQEILSNRAGKSLELNSVGANRLERMMYWIHLGDWISWFASVERNVDAVEINVINHLKSEMSKLA
jgi:glucose/mannose-6-phosphate isomerase